MILLAALLAVIVGAPVALALSLGRRLARVNRALAVAACGLAGPAAVVLYAFVDEHLHRSDPGDSSAMAFAGLLIIAVLAIPVSLLVATLAIWSGTRRAAAAGQGRAGA